MKIDILNFTLPHISRVIPSFKSRREDRNTITQLTQENDYSLSENNQKRIEKAIDNLAQEKGESNLKFLIDTAENLKYGTDIKTNAEPKHDWKKRLHQAADKSLLASDPIVRQKYQPEINRVFNTQKPLSPEEKEILNLKENILKSLDLSQLKDEKNSNIKNVERNLNYFIVSSEVPLKQKKYILNRLQYMLSDDYHINPQLADKKTVVLAEILNDIVVDSATKVPNTKAINQKSHGMCAAISIARKLMSYEYKQKYVDTVLSELDDTDSIKIYDITNLGSGQKISVPKINVDFDTALAKGYRIVDASTTQWMNIADMYGADKVAQGVYTAFDPQHFSVFEDSHYRLPLADSKLKAKHKYYQSLLKAKETVDSVKVFKLKKQYKYNKRQNNLDSDIKMLQELQGSLKNKISAVFPSLSDEQRTKIAHDVEKLQADVSSQIDKIKDGTAKYHFLPNEETSVKEQKIKAYLMEKYGAADAAVTDKNLQQIRELVEMSNSIKDSINAKSNIKDKIAFDRKLFNAAAAYRAALIASLSDDDLRTDYMIYYNMPDTETFFADNVSKVIKHIEKTGDKRYIDHFAAVFSLEPDKGEILEFLKGLHSAVVESNTVSLDEFFSKLGIENRKTALKNSISVIKTEIENGDKVLLQDAATALDIKPDKNKIIEIYDNFEKQLSKNISDKEYVEIFNKTGNKNQLRVFADAFNVMAEALEKPEDEGSKYIIQNFNTANDLPVDAPVIASKMKLQELSNEFNNYSRSLGNIRNAFEIIDEENNVVLNTANPNTAIIKIWENEGKIADFKDLQKLQNRYNAIDKLRSSDEFSSRQGKISDPSLYKYTQQEKDALKNINKSINSMASVVNKELTVIYRDLKEPLEEQAKKVGVNTGMFWVPSEGHSGLYDSQEAKILQSLTDKPYSFISVPKAIDKIKNTPHSGISSTSVFHDRPGWHAQYISEIATKDGKDILFHDNTWGASEHENVWVDSKGVMRTDYSDKRGGELGYITDNKWRNGNYVDNLLNKTGEHYAANIESKELKKLIGTSEIEHYKFPLISSILVEGISKDADNIAAQIKDAIFVPDYTFIGDLSRLAQNMTVDQIKAKKIQSLNAAKFYEKEYDNIVKRLKTTPFDKGIESKADFDALKDDDYLKVVFEKAALQLSYDYISFWKELANANTILDVEKIRQKQKDIAVSNFKYAFAKDPQILYAYALNKNRNHIISIINNALSQNNISLTDEQKVKIISNTAVYSESEKKLFDGSLNNTIDFMVNKVLKQFDKVVPQSENAAKAKAQIKEGLTKDIEDALYFEQKDLLKDTPQQNAIIKYIDKKFNPETDEEFVKIYRKLQDMTVSEFEEATKDVTEEDLGYTKYSGYDIVRLFKASNPDIQEEIQNLVFQKYLLKDIQLSDTKPTYRYKKLQKKVRGSSYTSARTFDDLYRSFRFSLSSLNYKKLFNRYKDANYRKYGVMPAYPEISVINDDVIKKKIEVIDDCVFNTIVQISNIKISLFVYEITENVDSLLSSIPDNQKLNSTQRAVLNNMINEFITANHTDDAIKVSLNAAQKMLALPQDATAGEYKSIFNNWNKEVSAVKILNPLDVLIQSKNNLLNELKSTIDLAVSIDFPVKYRDEITKNIMDWTKEEIKAKVPYYDEIFEKRKLEEKISKYSVNADKNTKLEFFNTTDLMLQKIKHSKNLYINVIEKQKEQYTKILNTMLSAGEEFLTADKQKEFADDFSDFAASLDENTNLSTVQESLTRIIQKYNNIDEKVILKSKNFKKLVNQIVYYNNANLSVEKYRQNIEKNIDELENLINDYVEKHIPSQSKELVERFVKEYVKDYFLESPKISYSDEKADELHTKFEENYRKYHILNNPQEILDRYLELSAKDSEIVNTKDKIKKQSLIREKDLMKEYLKTALTYSSFVDIKSLLMEAEDLGNPGLVVSKFKNYETSLMDNSGAFLTMADDEAINYIVNSLVLENDDSTALVFLEKLGLTERFLKKELELFEFDNAKKDIDKLANIIYETNKLNTALQEELDILVASIDKTQNCDELIEEAKKHIISQTKGLKRQKPINLALKALDDSSAIISANPDLPASIIINQMFNDVKDSISANTNDDINSIQEGLNEFTTILRLVTKLQLKEGSKAYNLKQQIIEKYNKIMQYNNEIFQNAIANSNSLEISYEDV